MSRLLVAIESCVCVCVCVCVCREKGRVQEDIKQKQELIQQRKGEIEVRWGREGRQRR